MTRWVTRRVGSTEAAAGTTLVVLGGGRAGLVAAMTAAAGGHRVAMTAQRLTGGTCVNFGSTVSTALIRCAREPSLAFGATGESAEPFA